jgi:hypothetical protein
MTLDQLITLLPPTGLALLELVLEEAAETDPGEDEIVALYRAKTKSVQSGVSLWGQDYHELVWSTGVAVKSVVTETTP